MVKSHVLSQLFQKPKGVSATLVSCASLLLQEAAIANTTAAIKAQKLVFIIAGLFSSPSYLLNQFPQQVHHPLLDHSDLFNFLPGSPVSSFFQEGESLSAFAGLKQYIISTGEHPIPPDGFRKRGFVKYVVVGKGGGENQVFRGIWPASDELVVHIDFV
jgi:hypothetical protein